MLIARTRNGGKRLVWTYKAVYLIFRNGQLRSDSTFLSHNDESIFMLNWMMLTRHKPHALCVRVDRSPVYGRSIPSQSGQTGKNQSVTWENIQSASPPITTLSDRCGFAAKFDIIPLIHSLCVWCTEIITTTLHLIDRNWDIYKTTMSLRHHVLGIWANTSR